MTARMVSPVRAGVAALATALVMAGGVLSGCTSSPAAPAASTTTSSQSAGGFSPGADGVGDPYFPKAGNGGYDVASYDLDLRYDPSSDTLAGSATITAVATADLSRFNLDLRALKVEQVTVDGAGATSIASGDELTVAPAVGITKGRQFVVVVRYGGVPDAYRVEGLGEIGFLHTDDGAVAIGEPQVAASWFPVNDHPSDKAIYTIKIAAPDGLAALSNGVLGGKVSAGGWTTWTWHESKPMASYLAMVAIGRYRVRESTHDGKQVVTAVDAALATTIDTQMARTPAIVDFLESRFGPYPFDAIGGVVIDDTRINFTEDGGGLGFALENQSRPLYSRRFFDSGGDAAWVIVHELAHQWFGDSVSIHDWSEIWLNEGFASYAEWLWFEDRGERTAQQNFARYYADADAAMWGVPPGAPGKEHMFDKSDSVYTRGAMTLHALRLTVGDGVFFAIVKQWAAEKANATATTKEFIALAERISGKQLDTLFADWLYGDTRPRPPVR